MPKAPVCEEAGLPLGRAAQSSWQRDENVVFPMAPWGRRAGVTANGNTGDTRDGTKALLQRRGFELVLLRM